MSSRFQPVEPFTLETLVAMQQWSAVRTANRKPFQQASAVRPVRVASAKADERLTPSALSAVEPGDNK
jgi:hypothetical protein